MLMRLDGQLREKEERGTAIITVLACLALVTIMIIGFLVIATNELETTELTGLSAEVEQLGETAVQMVTATLREATLGNEPRSIWASQPGLIRLYGGAGSPDDKKIFKLYSAAKLVEDGTGFMPDQDLPQSEAEARNQALFTNLNAPVTGRYPIADPAALEEGAHSVVGFSVVDRPAALQGAGALSMPVRWLYVLEDGEIVAPEPVAENRVRLRGASEKNRPVGRIAYWTDDETTKINLNTAGGDEWPRTEENPDADPTRAGSYYDLPRFTTGFDLERLDRAPPVKNEFQRAPGHPATTYLSAVFPELTTEELGGILPRIDSGGTRGGEEDVLENEPASIEIDPERLYATIAELVYNPDRTRQEIIDEERLEAARFCLTTEARSSNLNPLGRPRVSIWPVHEEGKTTTRTPYDERTVLASQLTPEGGAVQPYYFTRGDPLDPQSDISSGRNQELYGYLLNQFQKEKIPGYGDTFLDKFGSPDTQQIATSIYDYIRATNINDKSSPDNNFTPFSPEGVVYPTIIGGTAGFGRFETVSELGFMFFQTDEISPMLDPAMPEWERVTLRVAVLWEGNLLTAGNVVYKQRHKVKIDGLDKSIDLSIAGGGEALINVGKAGWVDTATLEFINVASGGSMEASAYADTAFGVSGFGGAMSPVSQFVRGGSTDRGVSGPDGYLFMTDFFHVDFKKGDRGKIKIKATFKEPVKIGLRDLRDNVLGDYAFGFDRVPVSPALGVAPPPPQTPLPTASSFEFLLPHFPTPMSFAERIGARIGSGYGDFIVSDGADRNDVVRTLEPSGRNGAKGDLRVHHILAASGGVPTSEYAGDPSYEDSTKRVLHGFSSGRLPLKNDSDSQLGALVEGVDYIGGSGAGAKPNFSSLVDFAKNSKGSPGDWDNGVGVLPDGPYINWPSSGLIEKQGESYNYEIPDPRKDRAASSENVFSPHAMVPSAVMFGSLPTGAHSSMPWQTLLFNPGPAAGGAHFSLTEPGPPDHTLLEFFTMPVVEPYGLSDPVSASGRINLNTQIAPFTYIRRDTGLYAVLAAERVTTIPESEGASYKEDRGAISNIPGNRKYRYPIEMDLTVEGIRKKFKDGEIYRYPSEICDVFLVPDQPALVDKLTEGYDAMDLMAFWTDPAKTGLTGDNTRERPYAGVYPRLTTRSNTYTVHVRAQVLRKNRASRAEEFNEREDDVVAEWRGATVLERFIDPSDPLIDDFAGSATPAIDNLDQLHKIRPLRTWRFAPVPRTLKKGVAR